MQIWIKKFATRVLYLALCGSPRLLQTLQIFHMYLPHLSRNGNGLSFVKRSECFAPNKCTTATAIWLAQHGAVEYSGVSLGYTGKLTVPIDERQHEDGANFTIGVRCCAAFGIPVHLDAINFRHLEGVGHQMALSLITAWHELTHLEWYLSHARDPRWWHWEAIGEEIRAMKFAASTARAAGCRLRGLDRRWTSTPYCVFLALLMGSPGSAMFVIFALVLSAYALSSSLFLG